MEQTWKQKTITAVSLIVLGLSLVNCSKSKNSSASAATASYVTCPSTGYYTLTSGATASCTPGTTVYTGSTTTSGYQTCPSTGYYVSNGVTYTCTAGTTVYVGTTSTSTTCTNGYYVLNGVTYSCSSSSTTTTSNGCAQYTAMYGVTYVAVYSGGQLLCVRYDLVGYY